MQSLAREHYRPLARLGRAIALVAKVFLHGQALRMWRFSRYPIQVQQAMCRSKRGSQRDCCSLWTSKIPTLITFIFCLNHKNLKVALFLSGVIWEGVTETACHAVLSSLQEGYEKE